MFVLLLFVLMRTGGGQSAPKFGVKFTPLNGLRIRIRVFWLDPDPAFKILSDLVWTSRQNAKSHIPSKLNYFCSICWTKFDTCIHYRYINCINFYFDWKKNNFIKLKLCRLRILLFIEPIIQILLINYICDIKITPLINIIMIFNAFTGWSSKQGK